MLTHIRLLGADTARPVGITVEVDETDPICAVALQFDVDARWREEEITILVPRASPKPRAKRKTGA